MADLSVLILAKNEEKNIKDCIESVLPIANEIVVVDDESTDNTAEIAEKLGARVVRRAMNGNWGEQQTFAINEARCEWGYIIDADERMTPELGAAIKKAIAGEKIAYRNARLNFFYGQPLRHGGWYPDYGLHLLPLKGAYVTGRVHQKIHHPYVEQSFPEALHLIHYPYRNWEHYFGKFNRYTELAALKYIDEGKKVHFYDIFLHPIAAFFKMYIWKAGWRDGKIGLILALFHFFYTMAKYVKFYYLIQGKQKTNGCKRIDYD